MSKNSLEQADDVEIRDPEEVRRALMIFNANQRRDIWVRHQVGEIDMEPAVDTQFHKGNEADKTPALHNFRPFTSDMQGVRHYPLTRSNANAAALSALVNSPPSGSRGRFVGKNVDGGRKPNKVCRHEGATFVFSDRCEANRL